MYRRANIRDNSVKKGSLSDASRQRWPATVCDKYSKRNWMGSLFPLKGCVAVGYHSRTSANDHLFSSRRTKNPYIDSCLKPLYNGHFLLSPRWPLFFANNARYASLFAIKLEELLVNIPPKASYQTLQTTKLNFEKLLE